VIVGTMQRWVNMDAGRITRMSARGISARSHKSSITYVRTYRAAMLVGTLAWTPWPRIRTNDRFVAIKRPIKALTSVFTITAPRIPHRDLLVAAIMEG
jgi:hypothetical protein